MPEGVEVAWNTDKIMDYIGATVTSMKPSHSITTPTRIVDICCHGKKTFIIFDDHALMFSYGMTGEFVLPDNVDDGQWNRHSSKYFIWQMETSKGNLYFSDVRKFASIHHIESMHNEIDKLGTDILKEALPIEQLRSLRDEHPRMSIVCAMLAQDVVAGIGNMYKSEGLHATGIWPKAKLGDLTERQWISLMKRTQKIMRWTYKNGRDLKVYENDNADVMKTADGRTTYYFKDEQTIGKK